MAIEIVSFPIKHGGSFNSYVSLPEGIHKLELCGCMQGTGAKKKTWQRGNPVF